MKKVISLLLAIVMLAALCPSVMAVSTLSDPIIFTWAWGANKIDTDNSLTVVSWSGGSSASYRSGFIVYDLPEGFTYTSVKTEVIASFAINSATLNNGTDQAPTAAVVMVDGDKVKEAYNLKSGSSATALLKEAKASGVLLGTYKIGKYPRTSRIKNANINAFFEKNPDAGSIGFYVTNLASDGYSGTANGIASAITDVEVNFDAYQNYMNATVNMVDSSGNMLQTTEVRNSIGSTVSVPATIEKDGTIWVRDTSDSVTLKESEPVITVTYHSDAADREKYVSVIEEMVSALVKEPVSEKIDLPTQYTADDGFVINIEWVSDNEAVVDTSGNVYLGTGVQIAEIYANVWIGDYTSVETKKFTVTVNPIEQSETDEALVLFKDFTGEDENRGNFTGEEVSVDCALGDEFTISAFVRVDDASEGGTFFNINGARLEIGDLFTFNEGQWYHVALTNSALYIDGEKECDTTFTPAYDESFIGAYVGKMDNFKVYSKAFSQSVINSLKEEGYDSPEIEIVSSYVAEGLDSVLVKLSSNGYEGEVKLSAYADNDGVRHAGSKTCEIINGLNVFSLNIPNMGGLAAEDNVTVLVWNDKLQPVTDRVKAERSYDFGFNYEHPDNHLLSNTFTLMDKDTGRYLTSDGISQRVDNGYWTASYVYGTNTDGYYRLANADGTVLITNCTFVQAEGEKNVYLIKNKDTGKYLTLKGSNISETNEGSYWVMNVTEYNLVSKAFASEGFFRLSANERERLYGVTGQAMWQSVARRDKLIEIISGDYFELDGYAQAERLKELFTYYPSYQINRAVNKSTTGVEVSYTLSSMSWTTYSDADGNSKSGYTATAVYDYEEEDLTITIYARSQNVVKNVAKGLSYMPYQFIRPLKTVIDYYATNNQFKAVTGMMYMEVNYEAPVENIAITGAHELGHLIDFDASRMSIGSYKDAYKGTDIVSLSGYGDTALNEDFAEFCQFVISCSGDKEQLRQLREMFPGRYDAVCEGMCEMYGECILNIK